ncbi:ABC-three component system protein [Planctomycetes bacterium TBK1r]|uniref:DUF2326 domain-containing protein n=1 Tax=Stieleria magnilauensis TaxID=2527963 RepID=A0ABX5XHW7_9BACT|nr:hypothetical protein TBK1r_02620 [Planctomycetes bacterium TBK1r]
MIHSITSSLKSFKSISLNSGLNLIVADKSENASDRQTRNGSGKSSLIRIIDFVLGSKCDADSIFRFDSLINEHFSMSFDLNGDRTTASRSGQEKSRMVVDGVYDDWPVKPKLHRDSGEERISVTNWRTVLGSQMFDLPDDTDSYSPTFRSLLSYFVRRDSSGGFQEAQKQSSKQQNWDVQVNLSFLLGLDWQISHELQLIRLKEKSLETLRREAKGGALGNLVGHVGELRTRLTVAERHVNKLKVELEGFEVLPEYRELEQEASTLAVQISELTNQNTLDREKIETLEKVLVEERPPLQSELAGMYREIGIILPELVTRQLNDVKEFHKAILKNRQLHLQGEVDDARSQISTREETMARLDVRRREILSTLAAHGALDQYTRLQEELSRQQATLEELRKKSELARQLESQSTELTIERAQIKKQLTTDLDDRAATLNEAIIIFEDFSQRISDHEGSLVIEPKDNGPEFSIVVEGKESKGIRNMQIFCFDMTLAVLWAKQDKSPGFLVHDSHLFDGMDSRQVGKALEIGAEQSAKHGFQYIVTLNSDQLEAAEFSPDFDAQRFRNPVAINDASDTGGLFGMRIH